MIITIKTPVAFALAFIAFWAIGVSAFGWALDRKLHDAFAVETVETIVPCTTDTDCMVKNPHIRF